MRFSQFFVRSFILCAALVAIGVISMPAMAADLTKAKVEDFVSSMDDVKNFADELKAEGREDVFRTDVANAQNFTPYTSGLSKMKDVSSKDYKRLEDIVEKHDFASAEDWAETGDSVMLSFVAIKTKEANPNMAAMKEQMTPEVVAQMPPEAQAQIKQALAMMETIEAAPQDNLETVKPFVPQITDWMESQQPAAAAQQ